MVSPLPNVIHTLVTFEILDKELTTEDEEKKQTCSTIMLLVFFEFSMGVSLSLMNYGHAGVFE